MYSLLTCNGFNKLGWTEYQNLFRFLILRTENGTFSCTKDPYPTISHFQPQPDLQNTFRVDGKSLPESKTIMVFET